MMNVYVDFKMQLAMILASMIFSYFAMCADNVCEQELQQQYVAENSTLTIKFTMNVTQIDGGFAPFLISLNGVTVLSITYSGNIVNIDESAGGVEFIGNASVGDLSFSMSGVKASNAGVYILENTITHRKLQCMKLYVLGKPSVKLSQTSKDPEVGGNLSFVCSGESSTAPDDQEVGMIYDWIFQNKPAAGSRLLVNGDSMTITKIMMSDHHKSVQCTATENIPGGLKSTSAERISINVRYAPTTGPIIAEYPNQNEFKIIRSVQQSLSCYVKGGNPRPVVSWDCYNGTVRDISGSDEVRKNVTWRTSDSKNGKCRCKSEQEVSGTRTAALNIIVLYPPSAPIFLANGTKINGLLKEIEGRSLEVMCTSSSNPRPFYSWTGPAIVQQRLPEVLEFAKIQVKAEGIYTCTVNNTMVPDGSAAEVGIEYASFSVSVLYPPKRPTLSFMAQPLNGRLSVIKGDNVSVNCSSFGNPNDLKYMWTGQVQPNSELTIDNIQADDQGNYTCSVKNYMIPTLGPEKEGKAQVTVSLNVMGAPGIPRLTYISQEYSKDITDSKLDVLNDTSFSVTCSDSDGNPVPSYRWSGPINSAVDTVFFFNINTSAIGIYLCNVTNNMSRTFGRTEIGRNHIALDLDVLYPPIIEKIEDYTLKENETLAIFCKAKSNPLPLYNWSRSWDDFFQASPYLTIENISRKEAGLYTCTAKNEMKPISSDQGIILGEDSATVKVRVFYFPDVNISQPNGTSVSEGDANIVLLCIANGVPKNYTFLNWTQYAPDGSTKIRDYSPKEQATGKVLLKFQNASYMDSGVFTCHVSNGMSDNTGNVFATARATQIVTGRPVVTQIDRYVTAAVHDNITLSLKFFSTADDYPTVVWYSVENKTRSAIEKNESGDNRVFVATREDDVFATFYSVEFTQPGHVSRLLILDVNVDDFKNYEVEISNNMGSTVSTIQLLPKSAPETPHNFSVVEDSITESEITVRWISGFHGGANQTFHVQYSTATSPWQDGATVEGFQVKGAVFSATIEHLSSETQYFFRLYSENEYGESKVTTATVTANTRSLNTKQSSGPSVGLIVGGTTGGLLLAVIIIIVVLLFIRRQNKRQGSPQKSLLKEDKRDHDDTAEINLNPMYESSDTVHPTTANIDVYAKVQNRSDQPVLGKASDVYAVVNKTRDKDAKSKPKDSSSSDVYSTPMKKENGNYRGKDKKREKADGKKKAKKSKHIEGSVYENAENTSSKLKGAENVYENPICKSSDEKPYRTKNDDGLIYIEVELPQQKEAQNKQPVIHGEDRTIYADVAYGQVGEPNPVIDEEE